MQTDLALAKMGVAVKVRPLGGFAVVEMPA